MKTYRFAAALASAVCLLSPAALAASPMARFVVVHGIPGGDIGLPSNPTLPVDVLVDGKTCLLKGLTFGTIAGPVAVPPATYTIEVSLANATTPCGNAPVITTKATLGAGTFSAVVAALTSKKTPRADLFPIADTPIPGGQISLVNANGSAGKAVFQVASNGQRLYQTPLGRGLFDNVQAFGPSSGYAVTLRAEGKSFGPINFTLKPQGEALLFAVGSAGTGSLTVLTTTLQFK